MAEDKTKVNEPIAKVDYLPELLASKENRTKILSEISDGQGSEWIWDLTKSDGVVTTEIKSVLINANNSGTGKHVIGITDKGKSLISKDALIKFIDKSPGTKLLGKFTIQSAKDYWAGIESLRTKYENDKESLTRSEKRRLDAGHGAYSNLVGLPVFVGTIDDVSDKKGTKPAIKKGADAPA